MRVDQIHADLVGLSTVRFGSPRTAGCQSAKAFGFNSWGCLEPGDPATPVTVAVSSVASDRGGDCSLVFGSGVDESRCYRADFSWACSSMRV